ncbi:MAG: LamG-like jellyroll fold domain-containing protein [Planctomycetota bacterium]
MRLPIPVLLALWALLPWGALEAHDESSVRTSRQGARPLPLPEEEGVFHFLIFGDRTNGPPEGLQVLAQAVRDANLLGPDLVMTVGDLVPGYNARELWLLETQEFRRVMDDLEMPWYPVPGNHDIYWRGPDCPPGEHEQDFEAHFGPLWYWFPHKNAAFIALYSDEGDPLTGAKNYHDAACNKFSPTQLAWLKGVLAEAGDKDHVFLFLHHPKWRADYAGSNWDELHRLLVEAGNVRAVFAGHIHRMRYDGVRDGIEYFCLATTGGSLDADLPRGGYLHHMNLVTVRREGITVATLPVGAVIDPRLFTEQHQAQIDQLRALTPEVLTAPLTLMLDGRGQGECTYRITNPAQTAIEITSGVETAGPDWLVHPDHQHRLMNPGESCELTFTLGRGPASFEELTEPLLFLNVDWLAPACRVTMPRKTLRVPLLLAELPVELFRPREAALDLTDGRSCLALESDQVGLLDGPFTLEAWMLAEDLARRRALATKTETSEFGLFVSDGQPEFCVHLDGNYAIACGAEGDLEVGRWYHIAGVYDGSEVRLYVSGHLVAATRAAGARTPNNLPLYIGADPHAEGFPYSYFDGWIDEVRLSKNVRYARASFEPERRFEPDEATCFLYHLDVNLGPFVPDHSPYHRHARRVGAGQCKPLPQEE